LMHHIALRSMHHIATGINAAFSTEIMLIKIFRSL
jgi:hypothetical protein